MIRTPFPLLAVVALLVLSAPALVEHLQVRGIAVSVIPGASHFFDNQYEFDLHEVVLQTVTGH
jgi:hypothetical protein